MDDLLEKRIRENKAAFDEDAPEGHFERFEQRLQQAGSLRPKRRFIRLWQAAAILAIALLGGNQVRMYLQRPVAPAAQPEITLASLSPEYREVEYYYTSSFDQSMKQWQQLQADGAITADEQKMITDEIAEFDQTYAKLQKELQANPDDERVINAMLELYQTRLSIINLIIGKLEQIKKQKATDHEREI